MGSHLSGGLDSSAITCVAHQLLAQSSHPLHTFSNIFERISSCDEREYFNVVLEQGHYTPHFIEADRLGPLSEWQDFFRYLDEPFLGPSHFLVHGLNRATQSSGVRICLDGFDGDTVVSHGSVYFTELAHQGKWETFVTEAKAVSRHFDISPGTILLGYAVPYLIELAQKHQWLTFAKRVNGISQTFTISRRKLWLQYGVKPCLPQWLLGIVRKLKYGSPKAGQLDNSLNASAVFNPQFAERLGIPSLCKARQLSQRHPQSVREDQYEDLSSGAFTHVLELSDHCASAFSIEVRHPFMDRRLVEFCLALPPEQKLKNGWSRSIMRRALVGILPEPIRWRGGKASMEENFEYGLIHTDRTIVENSLSGHGDGSTQAFLNLELLQKQFQSLILSPQNRQAQATAVWKGTALSLWMALQNQSNGLTQEQLRL
jgi:asparagine synthase (glutamine-hydrolysing)